MKQLTQIQRNILLSRANRYETMARNIKRKLGTLDLLHGEANKLEINNEFMLKFSNEVALYLDLPHSKIFIKDRKTEYIFARTVLICLFSLAGFKPNDIAWFLKMDHSTIIFHIDKIDGVERFYPKLAKALKEVSQILETKGIAKNIYPNNIT